jgi:hypothetical protein
MYDAHRRTIIVDYYSLRDRLDRWYEIGELRQGRVIADSIPHELERLLRRLGEQYGESASRTMVSLKDYSDRRLLLREGSPVGAEADAAVAAFEKAGFRRFVNPARRRGGSLLMEVMRDVLEDRRPRELVIATADPDVVDIVDLLRPAGVLTGLICVFTGTRTDQISGVPDGLVHLGDIADVLGIRMEGGFELTEEAVSSLVRILDRAGDARWLSLAGAFNELANELRAATVADGADGDNAADGATTGPWELPTHVVGRQRYIKSFLELMGTQNWRLAPDGSGVYDVRALDQVAKEAQRLAVGGWQVERLQELDAATTRLGATQENSWLGHETFADLLAAAREHDSAGDWALPEAEMFDDLYLERSPGAELEEVDRELQGVARFVSQRLNESDTAVTLVELANEVPKVSEVSAENGWGGRGSFLDLIRQANRRHAGDAWILDTDIPPGFIRLRKHARPIAETGKRPVQDTGKRDENSTRSLLRTVVPAFPTDDAHQFLLRAAVLATVLTTANVVRIVGGPNPFKFAVEARDLSGKTTGITGRPAFAFMLRTLTNDAPHVRGIRELELRLVQVTDEVSGRLTRPEQMAQDQEPLLGTRALLRIVSENLQRYLEAQGYGARYREEAEIQLGPSDADSARTRFHEVFDRERIDAKYKDYRRDHVGLTTKAGVDAFEAMLEVASMERSELLAEARAESDEPEAVESGDISQRDDIGELVKRHIIEWDHAEDGVTLLQLHQALAADVSDLRLLDVARILARNDQGGEPAWEMVPWLPYSRARRSTSPPLAHGRRLMGEREWIERSKRFWTSLIEEEIPVSWVEAARSMIRVEHAAKD